MRVIVRERRRESCMSQTRKARKAENMTVTTRIETVMESLNRASLATISPPPNLRPKQYDITL